MTFSRSFGIIRPIKCVTSAWRQSFCKRADLSQPAGHCITVVDTLRVDVDIAREQQNLIQGEKNVMRKIGSKLIQLETATTTEEKKKKMFPLASDNYPIWREIDS